MSSTVDFRNVSTNLGMEILRCGEFELSEQHD
jgi:hypothetical protein